MNLAVDGHRVVGESEFVECGTQRVARPRGEQGSGGQAGGRDDAGHVDALAAGFGADRTRRAPSPRASGAPARGCGQGAGFAVTVTIVRSTSTPRADEHRREGQVYPGVGDEDVDVVDPGERRRVPRPHLPGDRRTTTRCAAATSRRFHRRLVGIEVDSPWDSLRPLVPRTRW